MSHCIYVYAVRKIILKDQYCLMHDYSGFSLAFYSHLWHEAISDGSHRMPVYDIILHYSTLQVGCLVAIGKVNGGMW